MSAPLSAYAGARAQRRGAQRLHFGTVARCALAVSALYVVAALVFVRWLGLASDEAVARSAHLGSLFDGFDTSPVAFGLERPPLPTALAALLGWWPAARADGFAVALGLAACGGLGVFAAHDLARWAGLGGAPRLLFVAAFAAHPLLLVSGAIGLSEALYATLLLVAFTQFVRWLDAESTGPVIIAGSAIGAAYLLRYNVVWIAAALALAFQFVSARRGRGVERQERAQATALAFAVPVAFSIGLWAVTTWFAHGDATEFLRDASRLSNLAADDAVLAAEMAGLRGDLGAVAWRIARWGALIAAPSLAAIVVIAGHAVWRRDVEAGALAAVLASVALPEAIALVSGQGQPRVAHLFALVVPAFVALAYFERRRTAGTPPAGYDTRERRRQLAGGAALVAWAVASVAVLPLLPATDGALREVPRRVLRADARAPSDDATQVARWVRANASAGDVVVDPERAAAVMLETARFDRFRTPADEGGEATIFDPFGLARYVLVRAPVPDAGRGAIERAHPRLYSDGAGWVSLAFEAGPYRVYRVEGPTLGDDAQ